MFSTFDSSGDTGSGLSDAWDRIKDFALSRPGIYGGMALLIGGMGFVAYQNYSEMVDTFNKLDSRPSMIFRSVADCTRQGFEGGACADSQQKALSVANGLGTKKSYYSYSNCTATHGSCATHVDTSTSCDDHGNNCTTTTTNTYLPPVVGWQALRDDLNKAVPLYSTPEGDAGIRYDGKVLTFSPR